MHRWHLERLLAQGVRECCLALDTEGMIASLEPHGYAGVVDKNVAATVGVVEQNPGNWHCWAYTDPILASLYFLPIARAMKRWLDGFKVPRIQTVVFADNERGHRWVKLLGFEMEGVMRNWSAGKDVTLYSRVNR